MQIELLPESYGISARNMLSQTGNSGLQGAIAALETFYFAFNTQSLDEFKAVWFENKLIQLNNPLGGILRGKKPIVNLYKKIFEGKAHVFVEFSDIVAYVGDNMVTFTGKEEGDFSIDLKNIPLKIRTTRVFAFHPKKGWGQVHHHGSIDDPGLLKEYQKAVLG